MTRTVLLGAAFVLMIASGALAQTPPAPGTGEMIPPPPELAPAPPAPDAGAAPAAGAEVPPEPTAAEALEQLERMRNRDERRARRQAMRERRPDRFGREGRRGEGDRDEQYEWRDDHHDRMMGRMGMRDGRGREGAVFRFSRGADGPSIVIRCADRDTTQECVDAVGPMLQMMLPSAQ